MRRKGLASGAKCEAVGSSEDAWPRRESGKPLNERKRSAPRQGGWFKRRDKALERRVMQAVCAKLFEAGKRVFKRIEHIVIGQH